MKQVRKYIQEITNELQKVTWPTREQTTEKTVLVITVSIIAGLYLGLLDYIFQQLFTVLL